MTINIFHRHTKKDSCNSDPEIISRIESMQRSQANLRQDIREIIRDAVREELRDILNERNRRSWSNII